MNKKLFYTQPTTDLLELRSEGALLTGSIVINVSWGDPGAPIDGGYGDNPLDDLGD